ncbi:MAG: hypothetical protein ABL973_20710 [Micropepsaceae bacterium]
MNSLDRREFFNAFASAVALSVVLRTNALAAVPAEVTRWAQDIADLNRDLSTGRVALTQWQARITALNVGVDLGDLKNYLDFDRLTAAMKFPGRLAETADPKFPPEINIAGIDRHWFIRFFGMRRGGAIIPHIHNNMVSAHLVLQGKFHARTFDRVADLADAAILKPTRDETMGPGGSITMSDDRDNAHWLVSQQDRSFTFDVGVLALSQTRTYGLPANEYSMIFVDPTGPKDSRGLITAPVMTFKQCQSKFAP